MLLFNAGAHSTYTRLCPAIGVTVSSHTSDGWRQIDNERIRGSDYKERQEVKAKKEKEKAEGEKTGCFCQPRGNNVQFAGFSYLIKFLEHLLEG